MTLILFLCAAPAGIHKIATLVMKIESGRDFKVFIKVWNYQIPILPKSAGLSVSVLLLFLQF